MKILLLCWRDTGHPEGGGSERYLERVAEHLVRHGHDVVFRTAAYTGQTHSSERAGIHFSRGGGNFSVYPRAWVAMLAARVGLGPIAKALGGRPDIVVDTQNGVPFFARVFSGVPTIILTHHCHHEQWPVAGPIVGRVGWFIESKLSPILHRKCRYVTVSQPSASELVDLGVDRGRIDIIRNGVDPVPPEARGVRSTDAPRLVALSRLVPHKQIEHAIDAVAALAETIPEIRLDVIGSGWWADNLAAYAHDLGIADHVVFHGQVSEVEKHLILSRATVHVMPSRKEGWGLAVIEAAQHGVPTVGYRSSAGLRDSVVDGVTGLLVDSPAELVEATRRIISEPDLHDFLSAEALKRSHEFGWDSTGGKFESLLRDVAAQAT